MDAVNFLGHLRASARAAYIVPPVTHAGPVQPAGGVAAASLPHQRADPHRLAQPVRNEATRRSEAARPQGLAGKPPFSKDRYPASFAGRPKGAKSKAPGRRQMEAALSAAVAMRAGNPKYEAESTAPDFLERFGVKRTVITRLANELSLGNMTMTGAVSSFQESVSRLKSVPDGSYVLPATQRLVEVETARVGGNQSAYVHTLAHQGEVSRVGVAGGVGAAAVGQTSTGFVPGGQIASTVPSAPPAVSAMIHDERPMHGTAGAGAVGGAAPGEFPVADGFRDDRPFAPRAPAPYPKAFGDDEEGALPFPPGAAPHEKRTPAADERVSALPFPPGAAINTAVGRRTRSALPPPRTDVESRGYKSPKPKPKPKPKAK